MAGGLTGSQRLSTTNMESLSNLMQNRSLWKQATEAVLPSTSTEDGKLGLKGCKRSVLKQSPAPSFDHIDLTFEYYIRFDEKMCEL